MPLQDFFANDSYTLYNNKNKGGNNNLVINQLSEQLLEQFEKRIVDKDYVITLQKETIATLKETILALQEMVSKK